MRTINKIDEIIKKAVDEGIKAGYAIKRKEISNYHRRTEKLLYSYMDLKKSIEAFKEELKELKKYGLKGKSKSIVYMPSGSRMGADDLLDAKIQDINYRIQRAEREIKRIDNALEAVKNDRWYIIIELKYFKNMCDEEISEIDIIKCDPSTVRRHKNRLVSKIAIRLFGADAL